MDYNVHNFTSLLEISLCYFLAVVAIELLAACQAIEFLRPLKTTPPLEEVYKMVRNSAK